MSACERGPQRACSPRLPRMVRACSVRCCLRPVPRELPWALLLLLFSLSSLSAWLAGTAAAAMAAGEKQDQVCEQASRC